MEYNAKKEHYAAFLDPLCSSPLVSSTRCDAGACVPNSRALCLQAEGLDKLVEHNAKKVQERQLEELKVHLTEMLTSDPPAELPELLEAAKEKKTEYKLPDAELIKVSMKLYTHTLHTNRAPPVGNAVRT